MRSLDGDAASLGSRMGNLALSLAPLALASGAVLGATTQFTASEVAQAEQYLAMAGFKAQQNIAALPGVLNLAAATATDLGRAADISSGILGAFGMKAEEMGTVADVLAMTCATANTDMEKLGDTMKYVAPVARTAGLSIQETAAMAGLLGNVGIKGSQAGTTLKAMLNKLAAPAKDAQEVFQKLGITVKDQAGNLRSPVTILGEMAGKLENMGTAEQMAAMKAVVGEEAVAGFAELIKQGGIGNLKDYIKVLDESGGACGRMAEQMNDTLAGDMRGLGSAFESVQITIGKIFIPVLRRLVAIITAVIRAIDKFSQSKAGQVILKLVAALSAGVVAITAFSGAMWGLSKIAPMLSSVFGGIRAAMLGLGAPVWAIIAALGLLYLAWKNNFGGIATVVARWCRNISLVFQGVCAVFDTLKGSTGEIRGELAKDIKAAGLVGLVTNVGKLVFRIREFFAGIFDGINFNAIINAFMPAINKIRQLLDLVGNAIARVFGAEVSSAASSARGLGEFIGNVLTRAMEALATAILVAVNSIESVISFFRLLYSLLSGDFSSACAMAREIWDNFCASLMAIADLLGIGDWLRGAGQAISDFFSSLNLLDGIRQAWNAVMDFFAGINLFESGARLIETLKEGVLSAASGLIEGVKGVFSGIRKLLPFSDAKEGPLSELTLSGARMMTTLGEGVNQGSDSLKESVSGVLGEVNGQLQNFQDGMKPLENLTPELPQPAGMQIDAPEMPGLPGPATLSLAYGEIPDLPSGVLTEGMIQIARPDLPEMYPVSTGFEPPQISQNPALTGPVSPALSLEIDMPAMPELPKLGLDSPTLPELAPLAPPVVPDINPARIEFGAMPDLPELEISHAIEPSALSVRAGAIPDVNIPEIPEPKAPHVAIPDAPMNFPEADARSCETQAGGMQQAQSITIHIGNLNLPDVDDPEKFASKFLNLIQGQISQMEGSPA